MPAVLLIVIIFLLAALLFFFHNKRKQKKKAIHPLQKKLVLELIDDLRKNKIDILLPNTEPKDSFITLTLFELKDFIDSKRELAKEKYDEFNLLFTNNFNQVIDFQKYFKDAILPKE